MDKLNIFVQKEGKYAQSKSLDNLHVNMSNTLIKAAHGLTLNEKRLLACCIAKIDSMRIGSRPGFEQMRVKLTVAEYLDIYGTDSKIAYRDMISASDNLFSRYIRINTKTPKGDKEIKFRWISGVIYHHGEGWIELGFSPEVTPHLTLLREQYTSYKLKSAAAIRSIYSWRLFELLKSVAKKNRMEGKLLIMLDDFKRAMDTPDNYTWNNVRQRCVLPATKELKEKDNLKIDWSTRKKGRSVISLSFDFKENEQMNLSLI